MPAPVLGVRTVLGSAEETVAYGTAAAIDQRHAFLSEGLTPSQDVIASEAITGAADAVRLGASRAINTRSAGGQLTLEVSRSGFGRWLKLMLQGVSTIAQQDATAAWLQTHQLGTVVHPATIQKVLRDPAGATVATLTFLGCVVASWELSVSTRQLLQARLTIDAREARTDVAAATLLALPVPAPKPWTFKEGTLSFDGTPVARVSEAQISCDNALATDTHFLGGSGLKDQPYVNGFKSPSGQLTYEVTDLALYNAWTADTAVALELAFTGDNIEDTYDEELVVTMPDVRLTGGAPEVSGPTALAPRVPFDAVYDGTNNPLVVTYQSVDTAI